MPHLIHARHSLLSLPTSITLSRLAFGLLGIVANSLGSPLPTSTSIDSLETAQGGSETVQGWHELVAQSLDRLAKRQVDEGTPGGMGHKEFALKLVFSIAFVLLGGVFSGLSLGLMGLNQTNLQVLATSAPPQDRHDARKVLKLLSHGRHSVLCTLLLSNVVVNETLPVFLDSLTGGGGLLAVVISSALIVIFGEVLPQALCAQYGLRVGAKCTGFVRVLMYLESPICYPTAKLLDWLLGSHPATLYRREELKTLISLHSASSFSRPADSASPAYAALSSEGGPLSEAEVELVNGLLNGAERSVREVVEAGRRRKGAIYCVDDGRRMCEVDLKQILLRMQPYVPVKRSRSFDAKEKEGEERYIGFVKVEQIITALSYPNELVRTLPLSPLAQVLPDTSVSECVAYLKDNPEAVLLVSDADDHNPNAPPLGFLTFSDLSVSLLGSPPAPAESSSSATASAAAVLARESVTGWHAGMGRSRSSSIGLGSFVRGIVDRQLAHASRPNGAGHRASSSQLSFRLSFSDDDASSSDPEIYSNGDASAQRALFTRTRPRSQSRAAHSLSHSHHRSTSSLHSLHSLHSKQNFRPSSVAPAVLSPASAGGGLGVGRGGGLGGKYRFPSPVFEENDAFSLGGTEDYDEDEDEGRSRRFSLSVSGWSLRKDGDNSGFVEQDGRAGEGDGQLGLQGCEGDPLGARGGEGG